MMTAWIGLGSNLGDRKSNLELAARALRAASSTRRARVSPIYENPAVVPDGAPSAWRIPYYNAAAEIDWSGSPQELLSLLKSIERDLGRQPAARWAPRAIDLDILLMRDGNEWLELQSDSLVLPHAGLAGRAFVLDPLKDLVPAMLIPNSAKGAKTALALARAHPRHAPLWMAILNVTPDSFSDGGLLREPSEIEARARAFVDAGVHILDVGGESTRPGASALTLEEEWSRLQPALEIVAAVRSNNLFRPLVSVDTRRALVARLALNAGADWINDVSGFSDPGMLEFVRDSGCGYVLMHSLSVPADRERTLPEDSDPVAEIKAWAIERLERLAEAGVDLNKVCFDPGIGFGKTPAQSLAIAQRAREFSDLPVRTLFGHSRKSFMRLWTGLPPAATDLESVGVSLRLASQGADVLRVHEPAFHIRAHRAYQEACASND